MLFHALASMLLAAASATPAVDAAGNRIESLTAERQRAAATGDPLSATFCNRGRSWCATVRRDGEDGPWELHVFTAGPRGEPSRLMLPEGAEDETELAVWPFLVREADGTLLVGIKWYRRTMYSGGGAGVERLQLLRLAGDAAPVAVLEAPSKASSMVRACFSEEDMRARRRACHDEYEFNGTLTLDPATVTGRPRFILTTRARTYPGQVSRTEDSGDRRPLMRHDLAWRRDPECSYRRLFTANADGNYEPDRQLPACSDYLDI